MRSRVTFLGTGDAFNAAGRGHSACLIEDDRGVCAIDFGPTAPMALQKLGQPSDAIGSVLLTHFHGDHFAGLPFLLLDGLYQRRRVRPLLIGGPPGVEERVRALCQAAYRDLFAAPLPFELRFVEWEAGRPVEIDGRRVLPLAALHQDLPERAFSLRLESGGATIAFTGDTGWCDQLVGLAADADLLVCECSLGPSGGYDRHLGQPILATKLPLLRARRIVFTHLGEEARAQGHLLLTLPTAPGLAVELLLGEDGLRVEL